MAASELCEKVCRVQQVVDYMFKHIARMVGLLLEEELLLLFFSIHAFACKFEGDGEWVK